MKHPTTTTAHIRLLRATSADSFPPLEIEAAVPARLTDDHHVVAVGDLSDEQQFLWAAELSAVIASHECAARRLAENDSGFDFWLRILGNEGEAPFTDFLIAASRLPADDFEALASSYEFGELNVTAVVGPRGSATFVGGSESVN
jgi:hypothetical protein